MSETITKTDIIAYQARKLAEMERFRLDEIQHIANVLNISISRLLGEEQA